MNEETYIINAGRKAMGITDYNRSMEAAVTVTADISHLTMGEQNAILLLSNNYLKWKLAMVSSDWNSWKDIAETRRELINSITGECDEENSDS